MAGDLQRHWERKHALLRDIYTELTGESHMSGGSAAASSSAPPSPPAVASGSDPSSDPEPIQAADSNPAPSAPPAAPSPGDPPGAPAPGNAEGQGMFESLTEQFSDTIKSLTGDSEEQQKGPDGASDASAPEAPVTQAEQQPGKSETASGGPDGAADTPSDKPADTPSVKPAEKPAETPTVNPTVNSTDSSEGTPKDKPTESPTVNPTDNPTDDPTGQPAPAESPTDGPPPKKPEGTPAAPDDGKALTELATMLGQKQKEEQSLREKLMQQEKDMAAQRDQLVNDRLRDENLAPEDAGRAAGERPGEKMEELCRARQSGEAGHPPSGGALPRRTTGAVRGAHAARGHERPGGGGAAGVER